MPFLNRDGVKLYYEQAGEGAPLVLIHGWTCDHTFLQPQFDHFSRTHRVVSVDLRGHGRSDKPEQEYPMTAFADDVAWMCAELGVEHPVVVGHSMGGTISLVLAGERPELPRAIVSLDSAILPLPDVQQAVVMLTELLRGPDGRQVQREFVSSRMFIEADDPVRKQKIIEVMSDGPAQVMISAFHHLFAFDHAAAVARCGAPWLAIFATELHSDLRRLRQLCPRLSTGQTVGAGHFLQLEVPEQVNPMIERFLRGL
jgi:pimeloyl-ACP methyl ester carboxylesterase